MSRAARRWTRALPWVLAACFAAGLSMAVFTYGFEAPQYRAVYTLYALPAGESAQGGAALAGDCERLIQTQAFRREVLGPALSGETCRVDVRAVAGTHMMEILTTGPDEAQTSRLANAVGEALLERMEGLFDVRAVREIERAQMPAKPYQGGKPRRVLRTALLVFCIGSLLALCIPSERTILSHKLPQAAAFSVGTVGDLRRAERRYLKRKRAHRETGTFLDSVNRWIREDIRKAVLSIRAFRQPARSFVLAAMGHGEADGAFSVLLAQELARQGFRVLLMEMQADDSELCDLLGVRARAGLLDYQAGRAQWTETVVPTASPSLAFVDWLYADRGVADVAATLWFENFLHSAEAHFDFVIMHAASVESAADAAALSLASSGVILVARDRVYAMEELETAAASIARLGKPIKGVVFTQVHAHS